MPDRSPPAATLEQLVERAAAAGPGRDMALADLARGAAGLRQFVAAFALLRESPPDGPRLALEFAAGLPDPFPPELVPVVLPALAAKDVPGLIRVAAAGRVLEVLPDDPKSVTPVARVLIDGLPRDKAVGRLFQLQCRVAKCSSLDALLETADAAAVKCPTCGLGVARRDLARHVWAAHGLVYDRGDAADPANLVEAELTTAAAASEPSAVDHAFLFSRHFFPAGEPRQVFQALAARGVGDPTQADRLLAHAADEGAGLCPVCLSSVPDPVPPLPPPAVVTPGRIAADGYALEVADTAKGRLIVTEAPGVAADVSPDSGRRFPPRLLGVLLGLPLVVAGLAVAPFLPGRFTFLLCALGWMAYAAGVMFKKRLPKRTLRAVDLAWTSLTPGLGQSRRVLRFLTRLSRGSVGYGSEANRATALRKVLEKATGAASRSPEGMQLLAAARVLQALDGGRVGKERVNALVGVFAPFVSGELTPVYAEAAAEFVLTAGELTTGDLARLAAGVLADAFDAGLLPVDVLTVCRFCPWFRRLLLDARPEHVGQMYAVWRGREQRPWSAAGGAIPVFELARKRPAEAGRLLAVHPDALLVLDFDRRVEAVLGTVMLTARGLAVGEYVTADPDAALGITAGGGGWVLRFGPQRLRLKGKVPEETAGVLRTWLRFRAERLVPAAEQAVRRRPGPRASLLLRPLAVACPLCATECVHRAGTVGTPLQALGG